MLETHLSTCSDTSWHSPHGASARPPGRRLYSLGLQFLVPTGGHPGASLEVAALDCEVLSSGNNGSAALLLSRAPSPPPASPLTKPSSVAGSGVQTPAATRSL